MLMGSGGLSSGTHLLVFCIGTLYVLVLVHFRSFADMLTPEECFGAIHFSSCFGERVSLGIPPPPYSTLLM